MAKLSDKKKHAAYVLNQDPDFRYTQKNIGILMNVSQSAISNAIKEIKYKSKIASLEQELEEAKQYLLEEGFKPITIDINPDKIT